MSNPRRAAEAPTFRIATSMATHAAVDATLLIGLRPMLASPPPHREAIT